MSRVRIDKEGTNAYALAVKKKKTVQNVRKIILSFSPADSLLGVVTDWSDAEISSSLSVLMSLLCLW